jgi:radical SAM superfamily enzyme YgiQ (UPF0313 family)
MKKSCKKVLLMTSPKAPLGQSPLHYGDFRPPLGLGFLASALRKHGHQARIVDNYIQERDLLAILKEFKPDIIGIYVHTASFKMALKLIEQLRDLTDTPIVVGGPHASLMPESFPETVNHIVIGEGEKAIVSLAEGKVDSRIIHGHKFTSAELEHLDWPDYDDFYDKPYNWKLEIFNLDVQRVFSMNTSRGCPYQCTFCGVVRISGRKYRCFSAAKIVDEVQHLKEKYNIDGIYFREDNFTANSLRLKEFFRLMIKRDLGVVWASESRVDAADKETLQLMYDSGCRGLYIGVESGSQKVLDSMKKGITVEQIIAFFKNCKEAGIKTYATFCFGTPHETEQDRQQTEKIIETIKPTYVDRFAYIGIPKSELYDYILENNQYYYKDESGFIYPDGYRELARRYYGQDDPRFIP